MSAWNVFKSVLNIGLSRGLSEVATERDVLQQRMSEQALKISSLAARLQTQRTHAEALCHESTSQLSVRLHDALAEVQRLTDELESKDKQLLRLRHTIDADKPGGDPLNDSLYNSSCQPKDKVIILERELASAQGRVAKLEALAKTLEKDKSGLMKQHRENQRLIAEKDVQLQELLELKLDDHDDKENKNEAFEGGKNSARTLSDIVSISDYDEQDLQMRRMELKQQNLSGFYPPENKSLNRTLPPDLSDRPQLVSLNVEHNVDHLDLAHYSPNSFPMYLTSPANKTRALLDIYKRNVNETTVFGNSGNRGLVENCSMYPNREASDDKEVSIEPKKINFSLDHSNDKKILNKSKNTHDKEINEVDLKEKVEIYQTKLKQAEEQLCEFPALKEEVDKLKILLESTMGTMEQDKQFYESQLEVFASTKKSLEQQLSELSAQVNEKSNDLHLLKEDILRRENMVMELAKEKRNLVNKMADLELKYETMQRKNETLENHEKENRELKAKLTDLKKMEQLVSEKNLQIDNLNEHLNHLDNLQRCLNDKNEEVERLKETIDEKMIRIESLQQTIQSMSRDFKAGSEDNSKLVTEVKDLKEKIVKLSIDNDNSSFHLQTSVTELEKMAICNKELSFKLEDMKILNDKLKDKECEIEILNEDINYFHDEIASLKAELKMVSRSPSPRDSKAVEDKGKITEKKVNADKKELAKIRKHVSLLQNELAFNKKDLNEKAFELARAKLDITELRNNLNQASKLSSDHEIALFNANQENSAFRQELQKLVLERQGLKEQLEVVNSRLREEGNLKELAEKLRTKTEQCRELEQEMEILKQTIERMRESPSRALAILPANEEQALVRSTQRSPTAELENAVRAQLSYSHRLDDSIMEQILSGASHDDSDEEIPRLQLDVSRSSCSETSSSSRKLNQLKSENEKLKMQVANLEARLSDKEALIHELNRIRDKLVEDWQKARLQYESEKDNSGRLQLLLDTQKETSDSLQHQDLNMIQILKKRLESSMEAELELQQSLQRERLRCGQLERQLSELSARADAGKEGGAIKMQLQHQTEVNERLKGETSLLKSKLEREKTRLVDLQHVLDQSKLQFQREIEARNQQCLSLKQELAELRRLKHESGVELVKAHDHIHKLKNSVAELEKKSSIDEQRAELSRDITALKKCLNLSNLQAGHSDDLLKLKEEKAFLQDNVRALHTEIANLKNRNADASAEDKDQAVRFLHGRCVRLESCRKALVWQKRYLQRVVAGYARFELYLRGFEPPRRPRTFKSVSMAVVCVVRMGFLVRRRQHMRHASDCLLRKPRDPPVREASAPFTSNSPPSRDRPARAAPAPATPGAAGARRPDFTVYLDPHSLAGRLSSEERVVYRMSTCARAPSTTEDIRSTLSTARDNIESAALLANRLDNVSRRIHQVAESPRDVS